VLGEANDSTVIRPTFSCSFWDLSPIGRDSPPLSFSRLQAGVVRNEAAERPDISTLISSGFVVDVWGCRNEAARLA